MARSVIDGMSPSKLRLEHSPTQYDAAVSPTDGNGQSFTVRIGDRTVKIEILVAANGRSILRSGALVFRVFHHLRGDQLLMWAMGKAQVWERNDEKSTHRGPRGAAAPRDRLEAPMPGTVQQIRVQSGDVVAAHEPLVVMISMKMEMTLSSPHACRVIEVLCHEGQLVEMGSVLLRLEDVDGSPAS